MYNFNPRTREGCDKRHRRPVWCLLYFNPRTREGCDTADHQVLMRQLMISIHAPVKGATQTHF